MAFLDMSLADIVQIDSLFEIDFENFDMVLKAPMKIIETFHLEHSQVEYSPFDLFQEFIYSHNDL